MSLLDLRRIQIDSLIHLVLRVSSRARMLGLSQLIRWFWVVACSAIEDFMSMLCESFLAARVNFGADSLSVSVLCSFLRIPKLRPVSDRKSVVRERVSVLV